MSWTTNANIISAAHLGSKHSICFRCLQNLRMRLRFNLVFSAHNLKSPLDSSAQPLRFGMLTLHLLICKHYFWLSSTATDFPLMVWHDPSFIRDSLFSLGTSTRHLSYTRIDGSPRYLAPAIALSCRAPKEYRPALYAFSNIDEQCTILAPLLLCPQNITICSSPFTLFWFLTLQFSKARSYLLQYQSLNQALLPPESSEILRYKNQVEPVSMFYPSPRLNGNIVMWRRHFLCCITH